jgi:hypothetical protein
LEDGIRLQREGKLLDAEAVYGRVAAVEPNNSDAWHLLGLTRYQAQGHRALWVVWAGAIRRRSLQQIPL